MPRRSSLALARCSTRPHRLESGLERLRVVLPVKRLELPPREPDQRIAGTQRVVQEGEGMVLRQRDEPERQLGEVDRLGVAVHAVEAALGDLTAGEDDLVLVRRNLGHGVVRLPGRDQRIAELAAGFDQRMRPSPWRDRRP